MAEDWSLQVNFKIGQDLINVRAADGPELQGLLDELGDAAPKISDTAKLLGAVQVTSAVLGGQQPAYGTPGPAPGPGPVQDGPPPAGAEFCQHGQMVFKSGISAKGNAFALHECPAKDPNCQTKWAKRR
jgi:hypothetical protein